MSRLFKVICYSCGGRHKVFTKDQIMTESDFVDNHYEERVKDGFVVEITPQEAKELGYEIRDAEQPAMVNKDLTEQEMRADQLQDLEAAVTKAKSAKKPKPEAIAAAEKALADFKATQS